MHKSSGLIGDINREGTHSLLSVMATTWPDTATVLQIAQNSDFHADLLDPPEPFPPRERAPPPRSRKRESPATPSTSPGRSPRSAASPAATNAAIAWTQPLEQPPTPSSPAPDAVPRASCLTPSSKEHHSDTSIAEPLHPAAPSAARRRLRLHEEQAPPQPYSERRQAENTLAARYNSTSFEHRDLDTTTGRITTLYSTVVGAAVYPDELRPARTHTRLICQSSDGSSRLMHVSAVAQQPAANHGTARAQWEPHVYTTLWLQGATTTERISCASSHLPEVEQCAAEITEALERCRITTDEYSCECSPVTGAVSLTRHASAWDEDSTALTASSLIDLDSILDISAEVHEEPQDRAATKALIQVLPGLSDAPTNLREAIRRPDWAEWKAACLEEMNTLRGNNTIELATPPAGATIVQAMIQFRLKRDENGQPSRRKTRYCARGDLYPTFRSLHPPRPGPQ